MVAEELRLLPEKLPQLANYLSVDLTVPKLKNKFKSC